MNTNKATNPPIRKREQALIGLTILILACAVVVMVGNVFPLATAGEKTTTIQESERPSIETPRPKNKETAPVPVADSRQRIPTEAEPQEPPGSGPTATGPKSNAAPNSGSAFSDLVGPIIVTMAVLFALAILAILILVLCVFGLLRWFGPLIRIEHLSATPIVPSFSTRSPTVAPGETGHQAVPTTRSTDFAQEHPPLAVSADRRQDALVQRMFEEALQLQAQIDLAREEQQKR